MKYLPDAKEVKQYCFFFCQKKLFAAKKNPLESFYTRHCKRNYS